MKILLLDNYDSFTYNLVQIIEEIVQKKIDVIKNDKINLNQVADYDKIILSPGPGIPAEANSLFELIRQYSPTKSILGVCLGHQAIAEVFGGKLFQLEKVVHGIGSKILSTNDDILYKNIKFPLTVGRYHSWAVKKENFPKDLEITSEDENGIIMSIKHRKYDVSGVQYHPESILTPQGKNILKNWLPH